ncbi:MAG: hypothetical protein RLZZ242_214 [Bacteroidota bacterium]|jgi:hypothetical protein
MPTSNYVKVLKFTRLNERIANTARLRNGQL